MWMSIELFKSFIKKKKSIVFALYFESIAIIGLVAALSTQHLE